MPDVGPEGMDGVVGGLLGPTVIVFELDAV